MYVCMYVCMYMRPDAYSTVQIAPLPKRRRAANTPPPPAPRPQHISSHSSTRTTHLGPKAIEASAIRGQERRIIAGLPRHAFARLD